MQPGNYARAFAALWLCYGCEAWAGAPERLHTHKKPAGVGGFLFGQSADAARSVCERAGHVWNLSQSGFYGLPEGHCDGVAVDMGFPSTAVVAFCDGAACNIRLNINPGGSCPDYLSAYKWYVELLRQRYGAEKSSGSFDCTQKAYDEPLQPPQLAVWNVGDTHVAAAFGNMNGMWINLILEYQGTEFSRLPAERAARIAENL